MIGDAADHRPRYTLHVGGELAAIIQTLDSGADEPDHAGAAQLLAELAPPKSVPRVANTTSSLPWVLCALARRARRRRPTSPRPFTGVAVSVPRL